MDINFETCEKIYKILENISKNKDEIKNSKIPNNEMFSFPFLAIGLILFSIAFILKIIISFTPNNEIIQGALFYFAILGYLFIIISPIIGLIADIKRNHKNIKNPLNILFSRAKTSTEVDISALEKLLCFDQKNLELCCLELKHELEDFKNRITYISGSISKIGILPAILIGLTSISTQLEKKEAILEGLNPLNQFIILFSISIVFMYFASLHASLKASDLDRRIKLIEYAIEFKKNEKNTT